MPHANTENNLVKQPAIELTINPPRRFWAGGFGKANNLPPLLNDNHWSFTSPIAEVQKSTPKKWEAFTQVKIGDGFAIKGYGGRNHLNVHLMGEVTGINHASGEIKIEPWTFKLFRSSAKSGPRRELVPSSYARHIWGSDFWRRYCE